MRIAPLLPVLLDLWLFLSCSYTLDNFVQASVGTCSCTCQIPCSVARSPLSCLTCGHLFAGGARGVLMLLHHIFLFCWRLAYTPLVASRCLWKVEQERRLLFFRPATLMQDRPVVSQALATIQEGKAAMAALFWRVLSRTCFPQVSGLQQCVRTKSPSGTVYAQCRPGIYHANAKLKHDIL